MEEGSSVRDHSLRSGSRQGSRSVTDRGSEIVAAWLREHPGAEIVSRDRASAYAEATRRASPQAVQIADRSHLLRNLSEALRNALQPYHRTLTKPPGRVEALNS